MVTISIQEPRGRLHTIRHKVGGMRQTGAAGERLRLDLEGGTPSSIGSHSQ